MSRNLSVLDALVNISSHTTSCLPYKTRSNLNVDEAASSVAGVFSFLRVSMMLSVVPGRS